MAHARRRLDRWPLRSRPCDRPAKLVAVVQLLSAHGTPRVAAAFLRTAMNGWCTARRFQGHAPCALGCRSGSDCIEHYAQCEVYHEFCRRRAGLETPAGRGKLACFLNLSPSGGVAGGERRDDQCVLLRALTVYAAYRTQAAVRTGALLRRNAPGALLSFLREGARGHAQLESHLRRARCRPRAGSG